MMKSFQVFALYVLQGLRSPILVVNERYQVVSANDAGWALLGGDLNTMQGRRLEELIRPVATRIRTPVSALQHYDPLVGWPSLIHSEVGHFPRVAIERVNGGDDQRVLHLEVTAIPGPELVILSRIIQETHPEWIIDGPGFQNFQDLITPNNHILYFQDVTEIAQSEEQRQQTMRNTLDVVVRTLDHYIRNALTPILGYSELISRKGGALPREEVVRIMDLMGRHVFIITGLLDALRTVRDIHYEEPVGADATLLRIEKDLQRRFEGFSAPKATNGPSSSEG